MLEYAKLVHFPLPDCTPSRVVSTVFTSGSMIRTTFESDGAAYNLFVNGQKTMLYHFQPPFGTRRVVVSIVLVRPSMIKTAPALTGDAYNCIDGGRVKMRFRWKFKKRMVRACRLSPHVLLSSELTSKQSFCWLSKDSHYYTKRMRLT